MRPGPAPRPLRTVRYTSAVVALVAMLFGVGAVTSSQQSSVRLEASTATVRAGQSFAVTLYVSAHVPVNAIDIKVSVPSEVRITGIDTGESVVTLWPEPPAVSGSQITLRGGTYRKGFIGEHAIATINAVATASGLATFQVTAATLLAGDGAGTEVKVTNENEGAKLYIANADGTYADPALVNLDGAVAVVVVTDIDGDGTVTLTDVSRFMAAWADRRSIYDFNGDNQMNFRDFSIILFDSFLR